MNQSQTLLDLELRLLVARHGKDRVAKALSKIEDGEHTASDVRRYTRRGNEWVLTTSENIHCRAIEAEVSAYENSAKRNRVKRQLKVSVEDMVREVGPSNSEVARLLSRLARAYEKRVFLPDLQEIQRFLASRGQPTTKRDQPTTKVLSRRSLLPTVLRVLAQCSMDELRSFDADKRPGRSDLGIITDQILGHRDHADRPA